MFHLHMHLQKFKCFAITYDIMNFANKDDVLTCLIHLGYFGYNENNHTAFVPNEEVRQELMVAVESKRWEEFMAFWKESDQLLEDTMEMNEDAVAQPSD